MHLMEKYADYASPALADLALLLETYPLAYFLACRFRVCGVYEPV